MKKGLIFLLLVFFIFKINAQTNFIRHYFQPPYFTGSYNMFPRDIVSVNSEHFILLDSYTPNNNCNNGLSGDFVLMKTNFDGEPLWTKMYDIPPMGATLEEVLNVSNKMILTSDSNLVVSSHSLTVSTTFSAWIIKFNYNGDVLWSGGPVLNTGADIYVRDVFETKDKGFAITGYTGFPLNSPNPSIPYEDDNIYLSKLDSVGGVEWTKYYFGLRGSSAFVKQNLSNGYVIGGLFGEAGWSNCSTCSGSPFLLKTDSLGVVEWAKSYGDFGFGKAKDAVITNDGGVLVAGTKFQSNQNDSIGFLLKVDSLGSVQWMKGYNGILPNSISTISDSMFIVGGYSDTSSIVMKVDFYGDTIFTKRYLPSSGSFYTKAKITPDNGISIIARLDSIGYPNYGGVLIKTNSDGVVGCYLDSPNINIQTLSVSDSTFSILEYSYNNFFGYYNPFISCYDSTNHELLCYSQDCQPSSAIDNQVACNSYTWVNGLTYYSNNNSAVDTLVNLFGCDSIVTLNLTINIVDSTVTNNSPELISNQNGATYQWIDCLDSINILGATNQSYEPIENGSYAVIVSYNGCTDTSECNVVNNVGINQLNKSIKALPNPTNHNIIVEIDGYVGFVYIDVYDFTGKLLKSSSGNSVSMQEFTQGIYVLNVSYGDKVQKLKVIKN